MTEPILARVRDNIPSLFDDPDTPDGFGDDAYPAVEPLTATKHGGDASVRWTQVWINFLVSINERVTGDFYFFKQLVVVADKILMLLVFNGLFNRNNEPEYPRGTFIPEVLTHGPPIGENLRPYGNVVEVERTEDGFAKLTALPVAAGPPVGLTYFTDPTLITKFTTIAEDGFIGLVNGRDNYYPNIAKGDVWISEDKLEYFPTLPMQITVTNRSGLNARAHPTNIGNTPLRQLAYASTLTITKYHLWGSDVWGFSEFGWVNIAWTTRGGTTYFTSWNMDTDPPKGELIKYYEPPAVVSVPAEPADPPVVPAPPVKRAQGIDIAVANQVFYKPENVTVPHNFVTFKLSQGLRMDQTSSYWNTFNPKRTALDLALDLIPVKRVMGYHFLDMKYGTFKEQGDFFLSVVQLVEDILSAPLRRLYVDMEKHYTNLFPWDAGTYWQYGRKGIDFIRYVEDKRQQQVDVYTSPSVWQSIFNAEVKDTEWVDRSHWWAQYYSNTYDPTIMPLILAGEKVPWMPSSEYFKGGWSFWQPEADANGAVSLGKNHHGVHSHAIDLDVFNGTVVELDLFLGIDQPLPPPPPIVDPDPNPDTDALIAEAVAQNNAEIVAFIENK